ncbi:MAG: hypothetical protein M2R45_05029 [Verrucomicrobia subdivision 3 bacterium]|nr:hypothetical protein [Limisphaerales bacterium]MCS1417644.1 hypothetical protein [Limisphaerales bacterium]
MVREHLGWLVLWYGAFVGLIGLLATALRSSLRQRCP